MEDKQGSKNDQGQTAPTPPPPTAPIPPANQPSIPPITGQGATQGSRDEQPCDTNPPTEDKLTKNDKVMIALTIAIAFLPPKTPLKLSVTIDISEQNRASFLKNALGILIVGNVVFKGVLEKVISQDIDGVLICGLREDRFEPTATMHPKANTDQQKQG